MSERDELDAELEALGRLQRERLAGRVDAWDRVAKAERELDEVRRERLAAGDDTAQVELGAALFRPFDAQDDAALTEALLRETSTSDPQPSNVRALPRRYGWVVPVLVLAAVLVLVVLIGTLMRPGKQQIASLEPPPTYTVELHGSVELVRNDPAPTQRPELAPTTEFAWVLRPEVTTQQVEVRVFAVPAAGPVRVLELGDAIEPAPTGAVLIRGRGRDLGLEPGPWQIVIALAYERASLPDTPSDAQAGWRRVEIELEILP
jgi:hypothetical protein